MEKLRAVGGLGKERVQAVPLPGSIIFITTAGIPLIKPENLFKQTKPPLYRDLLKEVEGVSVMLEEYARNMIYTEELHQGEVDKMLRKPGDVSVFSASVHK